MSRPGRKGSKPFLCLATDDRMVGTLLRIPGDMNDTLVRVLKILYSMSREPFPLFRNDYSD